MLIIFINICEICNSKNIIHQHHENYNFPYRVISLCKTCHILRHKKIKNIDSNIIVTNCKDLYIKKFM